MTEALALRDTLVESETEYDWLPLRVKLSVVVLDTVLLCAIEDDALCVPSRDCDLLWDVDCDEDRDWVKLGEKLLVREKDCDSLTLCDVD